jgi:aspartate aminotransferase
MSQDRGALAARMQHIALSPTMKGTIAAEKLRREGVKVIDLGAGEPDLPTPAHVSAAAHKALDANFTKYTANMGTLELREAIARRYREDYGVEYAPDEVIATAGGKQALYHAAMALLDPGDEVVTHVPGWPTILEQIKLAGAVPKIVRTTAADGYALSAATLLSAVTPKTKAIIINSPGNPTGGLLPEAEARTLAAECARLGIWVVMDLCYERLVYDDVPHNLPAAFAGAMRDRFVICGSASKAYAMTGWRCGWVLAPKAVTSACNALQSHETSNVNSITQKAAVAALTESQACVDEMRAIYKQRRDQVLEWLREEPRLVTPTPAGAFYLYPSVQAFLNAATPTSQAFTDSLLAAEHVIVTPAEAFEDTGSFRLSYAASLETLREGVTRIIRHARSL